MKEEKLGYCHEMVNPKGKRVCFQIEIHKALDFQHAIDVLIHEWAHAMSWDFSEALGEPDHGPGYALAWSKCYQVIKAQNEIVAPLEEGNIVCPNALQALLQQ